MLSSVEKEERELERVAEEDRQLLRRQLFANLENNPDIENSDEVVIEREGSDQSDDEVEQSDHRTSSETSLGDVSEREKEITEENQNFILGKDLVTRWNVHMNVANLRGRIRRHNIMVNESVCACHVQKGKL
ncbi:hypothetical protein J6590_066868 [Homalodisca vitripennis]|nr:hypothetical protein J6590_066868 [Homalodisca vitripennis]